MRRPGLDWRLVWSCPRCVELPTVSIAGARRWKWLPHRDLGRDMDMSDSVMAGFPVVSLVSRGA